MRVNNEDRSRLDRTVFWQLPVGEQPNTVKHIQLCCNCRKNRVEGGTVLSACFLCLLGFNTRAVCSQGRCTLLFRLAKASKPALPSFRLLSGIESIEPEQYSGQEVQSVVTLYWITPSVRGSQRCLSDRPPPVGPPVGLFWAWTFVGLFLTEGHASHDVG